MKTMLDKCAVAGDITQAIDRRGAWSCAITVIGGTENTAVKLQSADSADGEFTDFKTLISADEAEADQYKGFVLDLSGAGNFIKIVGATMATCVLGDCDHDVKTVVIKAGEVPSGADLENNKTATINVSTYTEPVEIEPTEGKDGMKKATVTLSNIPSGGDIEANKEATIDVSTYTEPVEITPTAGKDGMAKATVILSNIPSPSGESITYHAWIADTNDYIAYAYVKDGVDIQVGMFPESITGFNVRTTGICSEGAFVNTIKSVSENTIVTNSGTPFPEIIWTRNSSADITI